jgi:hypothetical protein
MVDTLRLEIDALMDRAYRYYHDTYAATGAPPDRFLVTDEEYRLLQISPDHYMMRRDLSPGMEMYLLGMRVCRPQRLPWLYPNHAMKHVNGLRPVHPADVFPPRPCALETCQTDFPSTRQREIACPCGEVIWDISACIESLGATDWWMPCQSTVVDDDPLPLIEDLDEGLQCCSKHFATFKAYLTHRRRHG